MDSLNDLGSKQSQPFDQFKGKKTSYTDDIYTTKLDMSKVTKEQKQYADRVEKEITGQST